VNSFEAKGSDERNQRHAVVDRMVARGYTEKQVRRMVDCIMTPSRRGAQS